MSRQRRRSNESRQPKVTRRWWTYTPEETLQRLAELQAIGDTLGGGFVVAPVREVQVDDDGAPVLGPDGEPVHITTSWAFAYYSFMPSAKPRALDLSPRDESPSPPPGAVEGPEAPEETPEAATAPLAPADDLSEAEIAAHFPGAAEVAQVAGSQS